MKQKHFKKPLPYYIGNFLIVIGVALVLFTFFPIIKLYLLPPDTLTVTRSGFFIEIPKINATAPVEENVDPWDEEEYTQSLKKGVAHAKGTYLPGEGKMIFLFAHSSDAPWNITRYNTVFLRLGDLKKGDVVNLTKNGVKYEYVVFETKTVWPSEVNYLLDTSKDELILQTCTPIGTSLKRLLVFAQPKPLTQVQ